MKEKWSFSADSISRFRTECMGVACIWVLAVHALDFGVHLPSWLWVVEKLMGYGQVGVNMFFFLSGVGVYFSLNKRDSAGVFCINRCKRVLVPWLLISFPCLLVLQIMDGCFRPLWFILDLTTLSYWLTPQRVTWFVPVILLYYVLIFFYHKLVRKTKRLGAVTLFSMILCSVIYVVLRDASSSILSCLGSALSRMPVFLGGFWFGEQIQEEKKVNILWIVLMVISVPIRSLFHLEAKHLIVILTLELWGVAACFIVARALEVGCRVFHGPLSFLGSCSLEIYLLNVYFASIMQNLMKQFQLRNKVGMYCVNIFLSVGIGYLVRKGLQKRHRAG